MVEYEQVVNGLTKFIDNGIITYFYLDISRKIGYNELNTKATSVKTITPRKEISR